MNARGAIAALAAALLLAAVVAGWLVAREHQANVASVSSRPGAAATGAAGPQPFALAELAVEELAPVFPPFVFVVTITPPGGAPASETAEPDMSGRTLLPPVAPGSELAVSVVAGGQRFGYPWEETLGTASARAPSQGGRFYVVVPVRAPARKDKPPRLYVGDGDDWPVAGARVSDAESSWDGVTSDRGWCPVASTDALFRVEPPPVRPDLGPLDCRRGILGFFHSVRPVKRPPGDVTLPPPDDPSIPPDLAELELRPSDGRPFLRRAWVQANRVVAGLPLGAWTARWCADGVWREATLVVAAEASRFVPSAVTARATRVEVPGTWQGYRVSPWVSLLLFERSRASCLLPKSIVESGAYEMAGGRGYTARTFVAEIRDDGTAVFEGVAPGDYEIASSSDPFAVSWCVRIDATSDVVRVDCPPRVRAAQIAGRVDGPSRARYDVQVRGLGRFYDVSRPVTCPGDYEFADLAEGLYSVRAVAADAFLNPTAADDYGLTPWRNVVVERGGRVTVDFKVE